MHRDPLERAEKLIHLREKAADNPTLVESIDRTLCLIASMEEEAIQRPEPSRGSQVAYYLSVGAFALLVGFVTGVTTSPGIGKAALAALITFSSGAFFLYQGGKAQTSAGSTQSSLGLMVFSLVTLIALFMGIGSRERGVTIRGESSGEAVAESVTTIRQALMNDGGRQRVSICPDISMELESFVDMCRAASSER